MDDYPESRCLKVTEATEQFLRTVSSTPSDVLNGLADRPKPGQKAKAREAYVTLLQQIHALRRVVEGSRPLRLTTGTEERDSLEKEQIY